MIDRDQYGGIITQPRPVRDLLNGMPEIAEYSGFSEKTIKTMVADKAHPFPATVHSSRWLSSRSMIDAWAKRIISESCQAISGGQIPGTGRILRHPGNQAKTGV